MNKEKSHKILFIEDEPGLQKALKVTLEKNGQYQIFQAFDGEEGIAAIKKEKPDLILLDLILPKKNGFDILQFLKEDPALSSISVIVLTNLESDSDIERATSLGAKGYLIKADYSLDEIAGRIVKLMEDHLPEKE